MTSAIDIRNRMGDDSHVPSEGAVQWWGPPQSPAVEKSMARGDAAIEVELAHDVLQRVFALGLALHATKVRAARTDTDPDELVRRLDAAIDDLDAIARHIRNSVWRLAIEAEPTVDEVIAVEYSVDRAIRILIVDDDEDTRTLLVGLLKDLGKVHAAPDVYQALAYLDAHTVDVVVLDLLLPGANGVVLLERLNETGRRIPVVVVSGVGANNQLSRLARDAGAQAIVTKPFDGLLLRENVLAASQPQS